MEIIKFLWSKTNRWHGGLFILLLVEMKIFPGGQRGFYCNDPELSHPFTGDTISWKLLLATTVLLPLFALLLVEKKYHSDKTNKSIRQALCWFKEYLFGTLINLIIVQTLKVVVGAPRPHFFHTCYPKEAYTCVGSEYVASYTCTKTNWLSQSNSSFPSGHASLSVYTGIFLAYYIHRRVTPASVEVYLQEVLCIILAVICSMSRLADNRHHLCDVLAGAAIAVPVLVYTIWLCKNFETTSEPAEVSNINEGEPLVRAKAT